MNHLRIGEFYNNGNDEVIRILSSVKPTEADYACGYRFVGSDGLYYLATGHIANTPVHRFDLHSHQTDVIAIEVGSMYRRRDGSLAQMSVRIPEETSLHDAGFRFMDRDGLYYTENGFCPVVDIVAKETDMKAVAEVATGLSLKVGQHYRRKDGQDVVILCELTPKDADYSYGFRFIGSDHCLYLPNGQFRWYSTSQYDLETLLEE